MKLLRILALTAVIALLAFLYHIALNLPLMVKDGKYEGRPLVNCSDGFMPPDGNYTVDANDDGSYTFWLKGHFIANCRLAGGS